ncbi:MAG TPA: efflux RND transporter periplasmic adaptor subunit [Bacteroidetes bacterium]|nr:efflux RND transporter periplasmic adaptor subunit [Bacteroidota bacterium]
MNQFLKNKNRTTGAVHFNKRPYILLPLLLFAIINFAACKKEAPEKNATKKTETVTRTQTVEVVHPQPQSFKAETTITGTTRANRKVLLHAMASGYLKNIYKDIGDYVQKGQTVAVLENPDLTNREERLEVDIEAKRKTYERLQSIQAKTPALITLQQVEDAEAAYLLAKADLKYLKSQTQFLTVKAPFSGRVTQRFLDEGALVQSGLSDSDAMPLIEIQQTNPLRLVVPMPESDIGGIRVGMSADVTFPELPGGSITAKVSRVSNALDPGSKTMDVEIDLKNANGKLKPGMYAKVLLGLGSRSDVLSLPATAQVIFQKNFFLYVVDDNNIVQRVPLRKGLSNKDYFEVLNDDITPQSKVVIKGKSLIKPGQKVEAVFNENKN